MSKLLPVGTYVLVKDPGVRDTVTGRQHVEPREYYAIVRGYDMWRSKYQVGRRFMGWSEWLFSDGGTWAFREWCTEVTEDEVMRIPGRSA